jgi:hypothetical protein
MSISALGAVSGTSGTTYNFSNATNAQFLQEVQSLAQTGALSPQQQVRLTLSAEGGDSVPISGPRTTTAQALSDPTTRNFLAEYQNIDYQLHHTPGSVGASLVDSIVQTLQAYQGSAVGASAPSVSAVA